MSGGIETSEPVRFARTLTDDEAHAVWAALVAQVLDVHAPVWDLSEAEHAAAAALYDRLDNGPALTATGWAVLKTLMYPVHDVDHPDLTDDEWAAADALLAVLDPDQNA